MSVNGLGSRALCGQMGPAGDPRRVVERPCAERARGLPEEERSGRPQRQPGLPCGTISRTARSVALDPAAHRSDLGRQTPPETGVLVAAANARQGHLSPEAARGALW
jgi:hypothetical protein